MNFRAGQRRSPIQKRAFIKGAKSEAAAGRANFIIYNLPAAAFRTNNKIRPLFLVGVRFRRHKKFNKIKIFCLMPNLDFFLFYHRS